MKSHIPTRSPDRAGVHLFIQYIERPPAFSFLLLAAHLYESDTSKRGNEVTDPSSFENHSLIYRMPRSKNHYMNRITSDPLLEESTQILHKELQESRKVIMIIITEVFLDYS